jgi:UDP-N-acetylmuramyl pentapeptide phosphotransferase/UDP-N-acetylglucosamine-1-phosphate transferase
VGSAMTIRFLAPAVSAVVAFGLLSLLLRHKRLPLDHPNERSLHSRPVPRIGGLALVPGVACGWALLPDTLTWAIWGPSLIVFAISWMDDLTDLAPALRLGLHLLAAAITAFALVYSTVGLAAVLISILVIAWMTNLFNFMDGADGLAGGMALFGFGSYALAAGAAGDPGLAAQCVAVAAAAAGFLAFNFPPARVFLGDAGSIPLGFIAAAFGIHGWLNGSWPVWFPVVVFSPFIVDASVTLARRVARGAKVWEAHREHYYQRLVQSGWGHRRTALAEYALMAGCGLLSVTFVRLSPTAQALFIAACALCYLGLIAGVDYAWRRSGRES